MAVPNLAPGYLGQVKSIRAQREENERNRAFEADQASKNFLRGLGRDVLGAALGVGADLAGTKFRDYLAAPERLSKQGISTYDDADFGDQGAAIRKAAEARATAELRPQASFGGAAETGLGRRGIDTGTPTLGGTKADVLRPAAPSTPPTPKPSNPMLTPGIEAQFGRVLGAPVAPPALAPRGMEAEAPRRPLPAPQSAPMAQPRPMAPQGTREAPGGYVPPRMSIQGRDAMAGEMGVREALPYMDPKARGLEQQSQDVRDKRSLDLELMRKKLLWDEQQATANVKMLEARGASATAIAQARQQEADARKNTEDMRQVDLAFSAQQRTRPVNVKGLGPVTPRFGVDLEGGTDGGIRATVVPQSPMGRQGGGGRGGPGASGGETPTGDIIIVVEQTRDRNGNPLGVSQPRTYQESPAFWERYVRNPVDAGMNNKEAGEYRAAFRAYKAALPAAYKGDAAAQEAVVKAQNAMRTSFMAGQSRYKPAVAEGREAVTTSPKDVATEQVRNDVAELRRQIEAQKDAAGRTRRVGNLYQEIAPLADPAKVTADDIAAAVMDTGAALPGQKGRFVTSDGAELDRDAFEAAMRGLPMPASVDEQDVAAYRRLSDEAKKARDRLTTDREKLRSRRIEALALQMEAEGDADPITTMEQSGVVLPAELKAKKARTVILPPAAPPPVRPQAPVARPAAPAARPGAPRFNSLDAAAEWVAKQPITPEQKSALLERLEDEQGLQ